MDIALMKAELARARERKKRAFQRCKSKAFKCDAAYRDYSGAIADEMKLIRKLAHNGVFVRR